MDQPGQNFRLDTMVQSLINCPSFVPRDERTLELIFQTADSRSSNAIHFILNPHLHVDSNDRRWKSSDFVRFYRIIIFLDKTSLKQLN